MTRIRRLFLCLIVAAAVLTLSAAPVAGIGPLIDPVGSQAQEI